MSFHSCLKYCGGLTLSVVRDLHCFMPAIPKKKYAAQIVVNFEF